MFLPTRDPTQPLGVSLPDFRPSKFPLSGPVLGRETRGECWGCSRGGFRSGRHGRPPTGPHQDGTPLTDTPGRPGSTQCPFDPTGGRSGCTEGPKFPLADSQVQRSTDFLQGGVFTRCTRCRVGLSFSLLHSPKSRTPLCEPVRVDVRL